MTTPRPAFKCFTASSTASGCRVATLESLRDTSANPFGTERSICLHVTGEQLPETTSNGPLGPGSDQFSTGANRPWAAQCAPKASSTADDPTENNGEAEFAKESIKSPICCNCS